MKLFGDYEAVKFPEEDVTFITHNGFLYYFYQPRYEHWERHKNAGNDLITVKNYPDISKKELAKVMGGKIPEKITDILRLLYPSQLDAMEALQLIQKSIFEHRKKAIKVPDGIYKLFKDNDEDKERRIVQLNL